jgi:hypothetical protein
MSVYRFIVDCCWREAGKMTRAAQVGVFGLANLLAFIGWQKSIIPLWGWAALFAGSTIVALLVGIVVRAYKLESDSQPKVEISEPIESQRQIENRQFKFVSLDIENTSSEELRGCQVKLIRLTNVLGKESDVVGQIFRLNRERYADAAGHTFTQTFELKGKGDRERIDIAVLDEADKESAVIMAYTTSPTGVSLNAIPRKFFPHVLGIQVVADKLRIPVKRTFKLHIDSSGHFRLEKKY